MIRNDGPEWSERHATEGSLHPQNRMNHRKHPEFKEPVRASSKYLRLHLREPDFTRPQLQVPEENKEAITSKLSELYGREMAEEWYPEIERLMRVYYAHKTPEMIEEDRHFDRADRFTEKDIILITYGDIIVSKDKKPLHVLRDILASRAKFITTIHILPFFPSSSDRGFSIVSYFDVDPNLGTWSDIAKLSTHFELMFDGVINHVSSKSRWFQEFLNGNKEFEDFFIRFSTNEAISPDHLKLILRPRTTDLLTRFDTIDGAKWVWTTFSPDQIDLNFKNIKVLLRVLEVLFLYVRRGADIIRLDAVTYLWAELGTSCAHLEKTHQIIQLFRLVLDVVAPQVALITETNIPHEENISYFGDGRNEAQMVYNFTLPPLVLHSFYSGNCRKLSEWAAGLEHVSDTATYFNFLDSHDGVGLLPVKDILTEEEIAHMIEKVREHGGMISYRRDGTGNKHPYELNITWYSALNKNSNGEPVDRQIDRFIASRAIALSLMGVPGIYLPSLVGGKNDIEAVTKTGDFRSINRRTIDAEALKEMLEDRHSRAYRILLRMGVLASVRVHCPAFHPNGRQKVIMENDSVFSIVRRSPDGEQTIIALTNITDQKQQFVLKRKHLDSWPEALENLLTGRVKMVEEDEFTLELTPYQVKWLAAI